MFEKVFNLRRGQAYVQKYIDELFEIVRSGKVTLDDIITHRLPLSDAARAYDIFKNKEDDCIKVVLKP
jgi:alcohol dehydrogenase